MPALNGNNFRRQSSGKRSWSIDEDSVFNELHEYQENPLDFEPARKISLLMNNNGLHEFQGLENEPIRKVSVRKNSNNLQEVQEMPFEIEPARKMSLRMSSIDESIVRENMTLKYVLEQIHEEYFKKIEEMKQEKHNLQCEIETCENELFQKDATILDLKEEVEEMKKIRQEKHDLEREMKTNESVYEFELKQKDVMIDTIEKKLKECQHQLARDKKLSKDAYEELFSENENLKMSLEECERENEKLAFSVKTLEKQLNVKNINTKNTHLDNERKNDVNYMKNAINELTQRCHLYGESLHNIVNDGKVINQETAFMLKKQLDACQWELQMARKKNGQLMKKLEECLSNLMNHSDNNKVSLFDELDSSDQEQESIPISNNEVVFSNDLYEKQTRYELEIFHKLFEVKNALSVNNYQKDIELREMNKNVIINLLDDIVIQNGSLISYDNTKDGTYISRDIKKLNRSELEQFVFDLKSYLEILAYNYEKLERDCTAAIGTNEEDSEVLLKIENILQEKKNENKKVKEYLEALCEERNKAYRMIEKCREENEKLVLENMDVNTQLQRVVKQKQELLEEREQAELDMEMVIYDRLQKATQQENNRQK